MKYSFAFMLLFSGVVNAQTKLVPAKGIVEPGLIKNEHSESTWYALKDTMKMEIGTIVTDVITDNKKLTIVTHVNMKRNPSPWVDTTIALLPTLEPVYHSSYNANRDMGLHFGKIVTGFYIDKATGNFTMLRDTTNESYFDSNLYPALIRWLPYKEGFTQDIAIYDYNPAGQKGVLKASITDVKKGIFESLKSGKREVWVVTLTDDIGGPGSKNVYHIDAADRRVWKQEISAGKRNLLIACKE